MINNHQFVVENSVFDYKLQKSKCLFNPRCFAPQRVSSIRKSSKFAHFQLLKVSFYLEFFMIECIVLCHTTPRHPVMIRHCFILVNYYNYLLCTISYPVSVRFHFTDLFTGVFCNCRFRATWCNYSCSCKIWSISVCNINFHTIFNFVGLMAAWSCCVL